MQKRHADAVCVIGQKWLLIVEVNRNDSTCTDAKAVFHSKAEIRIAPCNDSNRIRTGIRWENHASDVSTEVFPKLQNSDIANRNHACMQVNSCSG